MALLIARNGQETLVTLTDGTILPVFDVAWGRDIAADFVHVTTNISPSQPGRPVDFFRTDQVRSVTDPSTGAVLFDDSN